MFSLDTTATPSTRVTDLRSLLSYGDPSSKRSKAFNDTVKAFRTSYTTIDGTPGVELYDWKSELHQEDLTRMVDDFLEEHGQSFWPDVEDARSAAAGSIQYSKNREL